MSKFAVVILLIFISFNLQAQTWEFGGAIGGSGYMGDLNPTNPLKFSGIAIGGFVQRNFNGYLSAKLSYTYGRISAADSTSSNQQFRSRNLSFATSLNELSLIGQFNFLDYIPDVTHYRYTPFIYVGIGLLSYNPQANYMGHNYELRPLMTEGEAKPYSKTTMTIPYGVGMKYNFTGKWNLEADIGYRNPSTDYLDDVSGLYPAKSKLPNALSQALSDRSGEKTGVYLGTTNSQRGDLRPHDTYMFLQLTVSYTFVTSKCYFTK
jgi:hypothetical protein